uniref:Carbonic anhydrase 8 n=1 Tax=Anas platyrhynchos platyrhynchos TaxID=8840 RepID=A0A493SUR7_ANAPP
MGLFHLAITLSAIVPAAKGKACCDISNKMSGRAMWHCSPQHQGHHRRDCSHCNLFPEPVRSCLPAAGSPFLLQLHLMHWNSTLYSSIDEAVGKKHGIAIIALFVQIGKEHVGLKAVTEILQDIQYKGKSKTIPCFNPNSLLPDPLLRDYWVYEGSLTIPPCSEGVTWILFRYPLTVSQVQIEEFRRLRTHVKGAELLEGCDGILGDNFRPTQPLSDRVIRAAFQ